MKNLLSISSLAFGLLASANVFAAASTIGTTVGPSTTPVNQVQCDKLSGDVTITISRNVWAAYDCNNGTPGSAIKVGTCSTAGQVKSRTASCSTTNASGSPTTWNYNGCSAVGAAVTVSGAGFYVANSSGGAVTQAASTTAGATCTDTVLKALPSVTY
jgi:hypothetical protein